jgi:hypothetical protein
VYLRNQDALAGLDENDNPATSVIETQLSSSLSADPSEKADHFAIRWYSTMSMHLSQLDRKSRKGIMPDPSPSHTAL